METKRRVHAGVLAVVAAATLRCGAPGGEAPRSPAAQAPPAATIATARPETRSFARKVSWIGSVRAIASVDLVPTVAGRVEEVVAADERPVRAGAVVFRLGGERIASERASLKARVEALETELSAADASVGRLERQLAARLTTKERLGEAEQARAGIRGRLLEAHAAEDALESQVVVTAPMAGLFTDRRVSAGQSVEPGERLGTILDPSHLRVEATLSGPPPGELRGSRATVRLPDGREVDGIVRRVEARASAAGATVVWIEGPAIDASLRPGETVSGTVALGLAERALAVPATAVVYDENDEAVVFVREGAGFARRGVRTGATEAGWVEIVSGLAAGDVVASRGAYELLHRDFDLQYTPED